MTRAPASSSAHASPSLVALKVPLRPLLDGVDDPLREVAHVDELRLSLGRAGPEDLAAPRQPVRPVGEAAGRIVRADDEPGSHDQASVAEDLLDLGLAERLQRTVVREVRGELVCGCVTQLGGRVVLDPRLLKICVDRDARDEDVAPGVAQLLRRLAHDARHVSGRVDHGVPGASRKRTQVVGAVAAELLGVGEELGVRRAAIEERQLVPAPERRLDHRTPDELGSAEDEQPHSSASPSRRRSTSDAVL